MIKVNLPRAARVGGVELFAGEQFVEDAVAEQLRAMEGVTFPDEGNVAPGVAPAFAYSDAARKRGGKAMAAELEAYVAEQLPAPAKAAPAVDKAPKGGS